MRLYRPHIPLSVKCAVAARQLKGAGIDPISSEKLGQYLHLAMDALARHFKCERSDLRLDHNPPLAARPQERHGLGKKTYYTPDANDPDYLEYRPHGPEFERSHLIKTNVRGDHGQHPDRVLIKREKRLREGKKAKPKQKIPQRKNPWPTGRKIGA